MASIILSKIAKSFGKTRVLNEVDISIKDGEFLTLVGPSGCGKSTLLRILAGLEEASAGDVLIDGESVKNKRASDRNLAMVFQSYALYPHLTVAENMMTPLRLRDLSFMERFPILGPMLARNKHRVLQEQIRETAKILKIEPLLHRKPGQLSGGQRQRVALGRAMVRKPAAFLMDEPLSNLDAALRVHMRAELSELHRSLGTTFVYVTHDQAEALTMSSRMAVIMGGEILQLDRPDVVYDDPADICVAKFVGSPQINILPGEVAEDGSVSCLGTEFKRSVPAYCNGQVSVGVRPEHFEICTHQTADFTGIVTHRENLGSDVFLHIALTDGNHRLIVRAAPRDVSHLSIGQTAHVVRAHGQAMVFAQTGERIRFLDDQPQVSKAVRISA